MDNSGANLLGRLGTWPEFFLRTERSFPGSFGWVLFYEGLDRSSKFKNQR